MKFPKVLLLYLPVAASESLRVLKKEKENEGHKKAREAVRVLKKEQENEGHKKAREAVPDALPEAEDMISTLVSDPIECGPPGLLSIAGSSTVRPVAEAWALAYTAACPGTTITVEGGGSSAGARRVCANDSNGETPVLIGDMSRQWRDTEAVSDNMWLYDCVAGDTSRSVVQVDVAIDGISVVSGLGSVAEGCLKSLPGSGLTTDQLRWIYSSYSIGELVADGWDIGSLPGNDDNDGTHLWSELGGAECPQVEIAIAGPDPASGTYEYFLETILTDAGNGETFRDSYGQGFIDEQNIVDFVVADPAALGYVGYAVFLRNEDVITAAPIQNNNGDFVPPSPDSVGGGTYNPLARRIFMNLLVQELDIPAAYVAFGMSEAGSALVDGTGFVAIPVLDRLEMTRRMIDQLSKGAEDCSAGSTLFDITVSLLTCSTSSTISIAGSSTVRPVAKFWADALTGVCPSVKITVEGGGSSSGARRVCADTSRGETPVEIGNMSRQWRETEATRSSNGWRYDCLIGDTTRSAVQVEVASDGISVVQGADSAAEACIDSLPGGGLTTDQLRWIFSSYSVFDLLATGWTLESLPGNDNDDSTHLWSELGGTACPPVEIAISGPDSASGTYEYFLETILTDEGNGETFRDAYVERFNENDIVADVVGNTAAMGYVGFAVFLNFESLLHAAAIENELGDFVKPTQATVGDGSYSPLARKIYMNALESSLIETGPYISFGMSDSGSFLVEQTGFVPIPEIDRVVMNIRVTSSLTGVYRNVCG